jgi:hypothetical protein
VLKQTDDLILTVLCRYILASEKKVLRKHELEAFIAQAFIQDMTDPSIAQDIEVRLCVFISE